MKALCVTIDEEMFNRLQELSKKDRTPVSRLVRNALRNALMEPNKLLRDGASVMMEELYSKRKNNP